MIAKYQPARTKTTSEILLPGSGKPLASATRLEIEMAISWYEARSDDLAAKAAVLRAHLKRR